VSIEWFKLTSCVKPDLYVRGDSRSRRLLDGSEGWVWGRARCEARRRTEGSDGDETVRLSRAPDAPGAARPVAVQALALSPRPALAGAGAGADLLVLERTYAFPHGSACLHASAPGALRRSSSRRGRLVLPARQRRGAGR
jgi:hypothetical protein